MTMRRTFRNVALAVATAAAMQACSSGGSSSDPNSTRITSGVAVDPYIVGAVLQELTPARGVVQESSPSDANGVFRFAAPLTRGNVVAMVAKGVHNGRPYAVRLERKVDVTDGELVVSPITTLLAGGRTPADVAALLNEALGASLTSADLTLDPMAVGTGDRSLLAGAIAVSAALEILRGDAGAADLAALVHAVAPTIAEVLAADGSLAAVSSAAAAVAGYVARNAVDAQEAQAAAGLVDAELVASLVESAAGGPVTLSDSLDVLVDPGTVAGHLAAGLAALEVGLASNSTDALLSAVEELSAADALVPHDATVTTNDADQARFFGGLARVALLARPYSDATDNGLNDLGDLLDAFGVGAAADARGTFDPGLLLTCTPTYWTDGEATYPAGEECDVRPLAPDSPRGADLQAFLANQVAAGLAAAIDKLGQVGAEFHAEVRDGGRVVELDVTDALFLKGAAQAMLAFLRVQQAYHLDLDLDALQASSSVSGYGFADFLEEHPSFLRLVNATSLPHARASAIDAIRSLQAAVASLRAETDPQEDDVVRIAEGCAGAPGAGYPADPVPVYSCTTAYNPAEALDDLASALSTVEQVATAEGPYRITLGTADPADDFVVDASRFFAGVDVRALLPGWTAGAGGDRPGLLPDPGLGGVLVSSPFDLEADVDGDGSPDLFDGYTYFGTWLRGTYLDAGYASVLFGSYQFAAQGDGFTFTDRSYGGGGATYAGTWTYDRNTLTLTFRSPLPVLDAGAVSRVVITADDFSGSCVDGWFEYLGETGTRLWIEGLHFHVW
jgi:hypothetical protein